MIRGRKSKAPNWSSEEIAILIDIYPREGVNGAADALPERSWGSIQNMAHKLGVRSPYILVPTPQLKLVGDDLDEAIRLRELGQSFAAIGKRYGVCETAAQNAILIALCPRKGFTPAERDDNGHLLPAGVERLRTMLRQGRRGCDISLELGLSVARIALERRRYNADLKASGKPTLPPPGNGERYSGAKIARRVYLDVESLLMTGYGAPRVSDLTGVSRTHVLRYRAKLVKRLARKGECLPGCDEAGRRVAYKDSLAAVHPFQKAILRAEILKGTAVSRAAKVAVVSGSYAHQFYHELKDEFACQGRDLPPAIRLRRGAAAVDRALNWLPVGKKNLLVYRRHLIAAEGDQIEAKRRTIAELMPKPAPKSAEPRRRMTFEEQLEAVRYGARLITVIPLRRPDPTGTLGGVSAGML